MFAKSLSECNNCNTTQQVSIQRSENKMISASVESPTVSSIVTVIPSSSVISLFPDLSQLDQIPLNKEECCKCRRLNCGPLQEVSVNSILKRRLGAKVETSQCSRL